MIESVHRLFKTKTARKNQLTVVTGPPPGRSVPGTAVGVGVPWEVEGLGDGLGGGVGSPLLVGGTTCVGGGGFPTGVGVEVAGPSSTSSKTCVATNLASPLRSVINSVTLLRGVKWYLYHPAVHVPLSLVSSL